MADFNVALLTASMRRFLIGFSLSIVALLQITQALLGALTQTFEAKSDFNIAILTAATLTPFLYSLFLLSSISIGTYRSWLEKTLALAVTIYTICSCFFSVYRIGRKFSLDLLWIWYNITEVYRTVAALDERVPYFLIGIALVIGLHYFGLLQIFLGLRVYATAARKGSSYSTQLKLWGGLVWFVCSLAYIDNEPKNVILQAIRPTPPATKIYLAYYEDSLARNKSNGPSGGNSEHDRSLLFIHLESVNAQFVTPEITPNLVNYAAQDGILFRKILAPSVLTIRSQETILCSVLPALKQNISFQRDVMAGLVCLPKILKERGFKTLYFHSYPNLKFYNLDVFMKAIGFDELHAADIMKPGDKLLGWGYAEDIFYQRVFEYLDKYRGQKIFAYIAVNTSNHFPFYDEEKKAAFPQFREAVPFPQPKNLKEQLASTMFIQDQFFGEMYRTYFQKQYSKNSHLIAFGDHSWPSGMHKNNVYSENYAFQENFVTSLAIIPASPDRQRFRIGARIEQLHSYLDLVPTVLEMLEIEGPRFYGRSFLGDMLTQVKPKAERCAVAVQPFGGGYVAAINYPQKYIFKLLDNTVSSYDLSQDVNEASPLMTKKVDDESLGVLTSCLASLKR